MTMERNSRILRTIPLLIAFCLLSPQVQAQYSGGTGEPNDPYQIATAEDLMLFGETFEDYDKHFILTTDIDLDPNLPGCRIFSEAIIAPSEIRLAHVATVHCRPFTGDFDGNGHTIRNLYIESEGEWAVCIGLFGCNAGQIRNIRLENINVSGSFHVGGLTGSNEGTITACSISGSITGQSKVGALAGSNEGTINSCHTSGAVWADEKAGGLVGYHSAGTIAFSYSTTFVDGNSDVGGLVGASQEGTVHLSYWDIDTSGIRISAGGRGKHSVEMMGREMYRGWSYPNVWTISDGADYPQLLWESPDDELIVDVPCTYGGGTGEPNDPFQIWSAEHLLSISYCPDDFNDYFILMDNIDFNYTDPNLIIPIGTNRWPFAGIFDGNGHVISNLFLRLDGQSCVGLFGYLHKRYSQRGYEPCLVKNLQLANAAVYGGHLTGALVGKNEGQIVTCTVMGIVNGRDQTGGLVGNNDGSVEECQYTGNVYGETDVGGICGQNGNYGRMKMCSASGTVTGIGNVGGLLGSNYGVNSLVVSSQASSHVFGINQVGGFAGYNGNNLQESYSTGNVTGQTNVGGFVGQNRDDVFACKCSGSVSGSTSVGGFAGYNSHGDIISCYSSSNVTGSNAVGGLIGNDNEGTARYCYSFGAVIADSNEAGGLVGAYQWELDIGDYFLCYWDIEASGMSTSRGGFGRPTSCMMQSHTFRGWARTGMWTILEGKDYPRLVWEKQPGELITNMASSYGGGTGEPNDPYQIWTREQFIEIAYQPEDFMNCFVLMTDIDMSEIDSYEIIPIGSYEVPFIGLFDGKGHTISNFRCVCPGSPYIGVFGVVGWPGYSWKKPSGATGIITDLNLTDTDISGSSYTGSLVGYSVGQIINVSATGLIKGENYVGGLVGYSDGEIRNASNDAVTSGINYIGGLVGYNKNIVIDSCSSGVVNGNNKIGGLIGNQHSSSTISSCKSTCQVDATGMSVGGLVGECGGQVTDCNATGNVSGHKNVGGLIGDNRANLQNCFATGDITADSNSVGGLAGLSWSGGYTIICCYATGDVQGNNNVGGLVGECTGTTIKQCYSLSNVTGQYSIGGLVGRGRYLIQSCYSMGEVEGYNFVGGLVGISSNPVIGCYSTCRVYGYQFVGGLIGRAWYKEVESCFWDTQTSLQNRGEGYHEQSLEGIIGQTTIRMQKAGTFLEAGWDFVDETANGTEDIWWINEGQDYPRLWWEAEGN